MKAATLIARDMPEHGPGWREIIVDCDHGTTTSYAQNQQLVGLTDDLIVAVLLLRHHADEGCGCTRPLMERYGLVARQERGR